MEISGAWEDLLVISIILIVAYLLVLWIASVMWAFRDVSSRTRNAPMQLIALFTLAPFIGIPIYLMLRPKYTLLEEYDHRLEAEALLHEIQEQATCPSCRRRIEDDFVACPFCRTALRSPCEACGKALASTWVLCPYCSAARAPVAVPTTARSGAGIAGPDAPTIEVARKARPKRPTSTATYTPAASTAPQPTTPPTDTAADTP
jgi:hypothetical protein